MSELLELLDSDDQRTKTAKELVNTEIAYVQHLNDIVEVHRSLARSLEPSPPFTDASEHRVLDR